MQKISLIAIATCLIVALPNATAQVLEPAQQFQRENWWYNKDFEWYGNNIPLFECSDQDITTTWYYRWDLLTKHVTYASPNTGYTMTEFIDRPFWSGAYGAISCPVGHQLYEARWLRSPRYANDYSRYWLRTPGAQPRNYSTWLADSIFAVNQVHPDDSFVLDLLEDLIANYQGWENRHFVADLGLFWQTGHDDGMEFNINSRQTKDILRGAPSYRPSFNAYMWADARAISKIAQLAGRDSVAKQFAEKANDLKQRMLQRMWDEKRQFFFPLLRDNEEVDGYQMTALSRTYESGRYAGDPHGRELIGYVPWQFNMLRGMHQYDQAWEKLMDRDGFLADFGPSTVERNDPMFLLKNSCCWWSGQSWPYATTQTLKALANSLQDGNQTISKDDYLSLLTTYARSHRKNGKPYLAEALHPDTGSFEGHDGYNHSEHYLHSGYCDLIVTGLVGLIPRSDATLQIHPLAPETLEYFAIDALPYRGHLLSILWDAEGKRYDFGRGLHILVDGTRIGGSATLKPLLLENVIPQLDQPQVSAADPQRVVPTNFAVNNDGTYYPRITASYTAPNTSLSKVNDGNFWYLLHPPNRWTCEGSPNEKDWIEIDLGQPRLVHSVRIYPLDDSEKQLTSVTVPEQVELQQWNHGVWEALQFSSSPQSLVGQRSNELTFAPTQLRKLRLTFLHSDNRHTGLTEVEVWGDTRLPVESPPPPAGNLAYRHPDSEYPKASCSYHDRFGGLPGSAIDGITNFLPSPINRWTSYESPNEQDWLQIDFGEPTTFRKVDLAIYDDRGGVQRPTRYEIEVWKDSRWERIEDVKRSTEEPMGSQWNTISFAPQTAEKMRVVFYNRGRARSGVSEVMIWND